MWAHTWADERAAMWGCLMAVMTVAMVKQKAVWLVVCLDKMRAELTVDLMVCYLVAVLDQVMAELRVFRTADWSVLSTVCWMA